MQVIYEVFVRSSYQYIINEGSLELFRPWFLGGAMFGQGWLTLLGHKKAVATNMQWLSQDKTWEINGNGQNWSILIQYIYIYLYFATLDLANLTSQEFKIVIVSACLLAGNCGSVKILAARWCQMHLVRCQPRQQNTSVIPEDVMLKDCRVPRLEVLLKFHGDWISAPYEAYEHSVFSQPTASVNLASFPGLHPGFS